MIQNKQMDISAFKELFNFFSNREQQTQEDYTQDIINEINLKLDSIYYELADIKDDIQINDDENDDVLDLEDSDTIPLF